MPLKIVCLLMRWLFNLAILVIRGDRAKNAEHRRSAGCWCGLGKYEEHQRNVLLHEHGSACGPSAMIQQESLSSGGAAILEKYSMAALHASQSNPYPGSKSKHFILRDR